ncbi:MAG: coenzyme F420-0:L-glutamate ligase, partial [Anaerolineae bacterium]|nr:coenzyme F420-0:L-glutamate ligase [Anaerolineae bacterium]
MNLTAIKFIPMIKPGDDLATIIVEALNKNSTSLEDGDILVLAQKIVSKAEGRLINLDNIIPSQAAIELSLKTQKDARLVELILMESRKVVRYRPGVIIVEHLNGFICANAGIDHSNVKGTYGNPDDWVLLLPKDSDRSAREIRQKIKNDYNKNIGVLIIDSHGRAWRLGIVGTSIGLSGLPALVDMRGCDDLYGYKLRITQEAVADELAGAASLLMGQSGE